MRHNLSLNDCFIKAGRSDNGKGHFWAIHPSNYQDFSNGDYHCRRARRRVRRAGGQLTLTPLSSPYHTTLPRPNRAACWCCPQVQTLPLSCMTPGLYWSPWSNMHPSVGLQSFLHTSAPWRRIIFDLCLSINVSLDDATFNGDPIEQYCILQTKHSNFRIFKDSDFVYKSGLCYLHLHFHL